MRLLGRLAQAHSRFLLEGILGVVGLATGVTALAAGWAVWSFVSLALGAVLLSLSVRSFWREWRRLTPEDGSRPHWEYMGPYQDWLSVGEGPTHAIYSPALNRRLRGGAEISVSVDGEWKPTGAALDLRQRVWLNKGKRNDPKLRLAEDLLPGSDSVSLDVTDYGAFVATNRLAYQYWWDKALEQPALTFERVEPLTAAGVLPTLRNSRSSNHLGGDVLAVGDGFTYLQLQNATNGMYPRRWVGSASGSFDVEDLPGSGSLQELVKTGLLRELEEEMALGPTQVPAVEDVKVVGYSRATYLGGKPQFYGVARITRVRPGRDRYVDRFEQLDFESGAAGLLEALDRFGGEHPDVLAPPLEMLLKVIRTWLEEDLDAEGWLWPRLR